MLIGTIQKHSLIDFPGNISTVVGTQGCNMKCFWCHNPHLIPYTPSRQFPAIHEEDLFSYLTKRRSVIDGVVITGGEPTIHNDLPEFCDRTKAMGFAIKLDTNGSHPQMLDSLIENDLIDYIAMDIKTDPEQYPRLFRKEITIDSIIESIELLRSSSMPYEFRTTCVSPFVSPENMDNIGALIKGAPKYYLQRCRETENKGNPSAFRILNDQELSQLKTIIESHDVVACEIR